MLPFMLQLTSAQSAGNAGEDVSEGERMPGYSGCEIDSREGVMPFVLC